MPVDPVQPFFFRPCEVSRKCRGGPSVVALACPLPVLALQILDSSAANGDRLNRVPHSLSLFGGLRKHLGTGIREDPVERVKSARQASPEDIFVVRAVDPGLQNRYRASIYSSEGAFILVDALPPVVEGK